MFEGIIKDIESEQGKEDGRLHPAYFIYSAIDAYEKGLDKAIDIIKEAESKPFDPESLGFELLNHQPDKNYKYYIIRKVYLLKINIEDDTCMVYSYPFDTDYTQLFKLPIKITSQFEAEIILKSFGVI